MKLKNNKKLELFKGWVRFDIYSDWKIYKMYDNLNKLFLYGDYKSIWLIEILYEQLNKMTNFSSLIYEDED